VLESRNLETSQANKAFLWSQWLLLYENANFGNLINLSRKKAEFSKTKHASDEEAEAHH
jgi:hypothetical protein